MVVLLRVCCTTFLPSQEALNTESLVRLETVGRRVTMASGIIASVYLTDSLEKACNSKSGLFRCIPVAVSAALSLLDDTFLKQGLCKAVSIPVSDAHLSSPIVRPIGITTPQWLPI